MKNLIIVTCILCMLSCTNQNVNTTVLTTSSNRINKIEKVEKTTTEFKRVKGIDVSHFNGDIDWETIKSQDITFAYAKATEGLDYKDSKFDQNWTNMKESSIIRGAYHFYVAKDDPVKQAEFFIKVVGELEGNDMPIMLDLEGQNIGGLSIEIYQKNVQKWLDLVEDHFKVQPIIYTNKPFGDKYLNKTKFSNYKLWIAEYCEHAPLIPIAWKEKGWYIWQCTAHDTFKGLSGNVDEDVLKIK